MVDGSRQNIQLPHGTVSQAARGKTGNPLGLFEHGYEVRASRDLLHWPHPDGFIERGSELRLKLCRVGLTDKFSLVPSLDQNCTV